MNITRTKLSIAIATAALVLAGSALASSHREAPLITTTPKVDGTDLYMFRSYETGRAGYVTLIANFQPFEQPTGGPNFYQFDPNAAYRINIDNNGDGVADIVYEFRFTNTLKGLTIPVGGVNQPVPVANLGSFGTTPTANDNIKNFIETYTVASIRGSTNGSAILSDNLTTGGQSFRKPFDNIGTKSIPNYAAYADSHIYRIGLDSCAEGRVFVGQRKESFFVAVGKIFDLFHMNLLGPVTGNTNDLENLNISTIALEVPIACLTTGGSQIIGAWQSAGTKKPVFERQFTQQSRLGMPLVNEVVIGLPDKDKFNASLPQDDAQFASYVTNPSAPAILQVLYPSVIAPTQFPRTDLVSVFLTGIAGLNKPANVVPSEMMRLNTTIAPKAAASQNPLGVIAGDTSGFPNGRRPGDDVVDVELRVLEGVLLPTSVAPAGQLPFTDGVRKTAADFRSTFPYLNTPLPGATDAP